MIWRCSPLGSARIWARTASKPLSATANPTRAGANNSAVTRMIPVRGAPSIDSPPGSAARPTGGKAPAATRASAISRGECSAAQRDRLGRRIRIAGSAAADGPGRSDDRPRMAPPSPRQRPSARLSGAARIYTLRRLTPDPGAKRGGLTRAAGRVHRQAVVGESESRGHARHSTPPTISLCDRHGAPPRAKARAEPACRRVAPRRCPGRRSRPAPRGCTS